jgi:hypothetical protein
MTGIETAINAYVLTILPAFVAVVGVIGGVIGILLVSKR